MANKSGIENIAKAVLSIGNHEQNQQWPPHIIADQYNAVTSFLIAALVRSYPQEHDILRPFIKSEKLPAKKGYVYLPDEYRNKLGASVSVRQTKDCECGEDEDFSVSELKSGCQSRPIEFLSEEEWDYRTTSNYKAPSLWNPIACFFGSDKFKVCPYNVGAVELRYVKKEQIYTYAYILQPDDTFIFDEPNSVLTEWEDNAFDKLLTGMTFLYSEYQRDDSLVQWSQILKERGLF